MATRETARDEHINKMIEENSQLRQKVADLNIKVNQLSWSQFNQPTKDNGKVAVIGSSIIKDINDTKLVNSSVASISGGCIEDVRERVSNIRDTLSHIYLVVGGNDCDNNDNSAEIVKKYKNILSIHILLLSIHIHCIIMQTTTCYLIRILM